MNDIEDPTRRSSQSEDKQKCCGCGDTLSIFLKYVVARSLRLSLFCLDVSSDLAVAYGDYMQGFYNFAYVTFGLVFAPGFFFSVYMICDSVWNYGGELSCLTGLLWLLSVPLLPIWPILRDARLIFMGLIATVVPKRRKGIIKYLNRPSRAYLLKFLEAFTEAAPQLVVRLLKLCLNTATPFSNLRTGEIIQICFSLMMMALTVVSTHQKNVSTDQVIDGDLESDSNYKLNCLSTIFAIIWWLCFLVSRLQALALFGSSYHYWIFLIIGIHVLLMFVLQTIASHKDRLQRIFIYLFGAFVFIFAYVQFNLKSKVKMTAWISYSLFTIIVFIENTTMLLCWMFYQNGLVQKGLIVPFTNETAFNTTLPGSMESDSTLPELELYWKRLLFVNYGSFAAGVIFMILTFFCALQKESSKEEEVSAVEMEHLNRR